MTIRSLICPFSMDSALLEEGVCEGFAGVVFMFSALLNGRQAFD